MNFIALKQIFYKKRPQNININRKSIIFAHEKQYFKNYYYA